MARITLTGKRTRYQYLNGNINDISTSLAPNMIIDRERTTYKQSKPWPKPLRPLPFSYRDQRVSCTPAYLETEAHLGYKSIEIGNFLDLSSTRFGVSSLQPQYPLPMGVDVAEGYAINKALSKIKDQNLNFAQAFAERQQTADLIAETASRIYRAASSLRKGRFNAARRALGNPRLKRVPRISRGLDNTSQEWLKLQYGWRPLLGDVFGAVEKLAEGDDKIENYAVSVKGKHVVTVKPSSLEEVYLSPTTQLLGYTESGTVSVTGKCKLTYRIRNYPAAKAASLGLTNPALLAWELLPFSFVADWFFPLGNYLNLLDATLGTDFLYGYSSWHTSHDMSRLWFVKSPGTKGYIKRMVGYKERSYGYAGRRQTYGDFPSARFPTIKSPFSPTRALNALALLQLLHK